MGVTKKQQVEKSLASDVSVNSDVTLEKISAKEEPDDYVCQTCGKHYKKRKGNSLHLSHRFMPVQMDI